MAEINKTSTNSIKIFTLKNNFGTEIRILNLGATVFDLFVKDKNGEPVNIAVGPKNCDVYLSSEYEKENRCFGASVGRYAGRISQGKFLLNNTRYNLYEEDGVHLHGGFRGFQFAYWDFVSMDEENNSLTLSYLSTDGEEGYPGNLLVKVTYSLTSENELQISYNAETDKATPVNITNHIYYNLNGGGSVKDHQLKINSKKILEVDSKLLPSGSFVSLKDHSKDFSSSKSIGKQEVDDTFVLLGGSAWPKVELYSALTGIQLTVNTNQPSVVVYIPKELPKKWEYKNEILPYPSICIETQNFPDAPNHENFPSAILQPGEVYRNYSSWKFNIK